MTGNDESRPRGHACAYGSINKLSEEVPLRLAGGLKVVDAVLVVQLLNRRWTKSAVHKARELSS